MRLPEYIFKGRVKAQGLLLPGKTGTHKSIIQLWQPGYALYEYEDYFLVMFNLTVLLDTVAGPGFAVKKMDSGYATGKWPEMSKSKPQVLLHLVHGAEIEIPVDSEHQILPSDWLELSDYQVATVTAFASDFNRPSRVPSKVGKEARVLFGDQFKATGAQRAILASLANQAKKPARREGLVSRLWQSSKGIMSFMPLGRRTATTSGRGAAKIGSGDRDDFNRLGIYDKIRERILASRMGSIVGLQNARYLRNMMDMFDKGDFENGLRHAIPLDGNTMLSRQRTAGFLRPLAQLFFGGTGGGGSVNLEDQFYDHLRKMYELAFRQLDRAEKYKEAAFVKAELLQQNDEAIKYLEGKNMYVLAAELAEARGMPPTRIIRQWLLAGNKERALWYAVATGEFVNAINLFENRDKDLANELRKLTAQRFIAMGRYLDAIEIGWPVAELRENLLRLLDRVALDDSATAMRMRVKGLTLDPARSEPYALDLIKLFEDTSFQAAFMRQAVISELIKTSNAITAVSWVAKAAIKSYYQDVAAGYCHHRPKTVNSLLSLLQDDMFRFDVKKTKPTGGIQQNDLLRKSAPTRLSIKTVKYTSEITDITLLQADYCLAALGDMGMLLIDQAGKITKRYNQPVDTFVESDERQVTLCLSHRADYISVFEFNWLDKSLDAVGDYKFGSYATSYDGALWFVSRGSRLSCIDLKSDEKKIFWQVGGLPGDVVYIKRSGNHINCVLDDQSSLQYWRYRFPALTLEAREPVDKVILENAHLFSLSADGEFILTALYDQDKASKIKATWHLADSYPDADKNYAIDGIPGVVTSFESLGKWIFLNRHVDEHMEFNLIENSNQDCFDPKLTVQTDAQENLLFSEYSGRILLNSAGSFVILDSFSGRIYHSYSLT